MLFDMNDNEMEGIPEKRREASNRWRGKLSDEDYVNIVAAINEYIDGSGGNFTSSYIPGPDWAGTVYEPLEAACDYDRESSGYFFGLIVWLTVIERSDKWHFVMADKSADDALGTKYWRKRG